MPGAFVVEQGLFRRMEYEENHLLVPGTRLEPAMAYTREGHNPLRLSLHPVRGNEIG
jgi:hypothetical protein